MPNIFYFIRFRKFELFSVMELLGQRYKHFKVHMMHVVNFLSKYNTILDFLCWGIGVSPHLCQP